MPFTASSPMEPPGKVRGVTTKRVRGKGQTRTVDRHARRVRERLVARTKQHGSEQAFDQAAARAAPGAVRHFDLRVAKADPGYGALAPALASAPAQASVQRLFSFGFFRSS